MSKQMVMDEFLQLENLVLRKENDELKRRNEQLTEELISIVQRKDPVDTFVWSSHQGFLNINGVPLI